MHIETLKTYCDLIESGSFSKAAILNFVSQSAVSQQVKALEQRFGRQLIERGQRKGVAPTEAGKIFYDGCKEILEQYSALEERMRVKSALVAGSIKVATVYSVGLHELPPYGKQFIKTYPQLKVHIEYARTDKVYDACLNNTIDVGIVALPLQRPNIAVIPFRDDKLVIVCNPEHKPARRRRVSVE